MPQDGKKMIFDRIQTTENYFGDLCSELSSFTKKKAKFVAQMTLKIDFFKYTFHLNGKYFVY